jgi:small multidrug resistance family-3 protein
VGGHQRRQQGIAFDGFRPDRADIIGALICLTGVGTIMYAR